MTMTKQTKKYKKLLATAATASLVASVIVPQASAAQVFPDVDDSNSHAENINALVEAGIINGYEDGTFKPNQKLTRGQVVKMLGKYVVSQGVTIPEDYTVVQRFDDIAVDAPDQELVKYAAVLKDAGIFIGTKGNLNPTENITRENMALTLDRTYKTVHGKSLVELAAGSENIPVTDLNIAKEEVREVIQGLRNLGITNVENFQPKEHVTRAAFASFLNRSINASAKPATEVELTSLTATAANQFTVRFSQTVTSTDSVQFNVTHRNSSIPTSKVEWNEAKTEAVVTIDGSFNDGTYDVTIKGAAEKELTASVTTTREQVTSIEFLSSNLVITGREDSSIEAGKTFKEAVITYAVYNQYGTDITNKVNESYFTDADVKGIDIADDKIKLENGRFIVWVDEDEDEDQTGTVEFTYEQGEIEIDVEQEVRLTDESVPAEIEIIDIYSPSDKDLSIENLEDKEEFVLLFKVKDQYGLEIDAEFADKTKSKLSTGDSTILEEVRDGIKVSVSDKDIFDIEDPDDSQTGVYGKDGIEVINVDGQYYFALDIITDDLKDLKGGENTVTLRAKETGNETSKQFVVGNVDQPYKIELGLPDEIIAGNEDVKLPVSAYNEAGELITDTKVLNEDLRDGLITIKWDNGLTNNDNLDARYVFTFIEEKGKVYLKFKTANNLTDEAEDYDIDIEVDKTGIEQTLTVKVEPNAYPASIVGIKDFEHNYVLLGDLREEDLLLEDQYGRSFTKSSEGNPKDPTYFAINVTSSNAEKFPVTISANTFEVESKEKGSTNLEFELVSYNIEGDETVDRFDVTFRSIEIEDFDSFKVKSDSLVYGGDQSTKADDPGIKVLGIIGKHEIELTENDYNITSNSKYLDVTTADVVTVNTEAIEQGEVLEDEDDKYEAEISVTINDTGDSLKHTLNLSKEDPKANSFKLSKKDGLGKKAVTELDIKLTSGILADNLLTVDEILNGLSRAVEIKDQYNNKTTAFNTENGTITYFNGSTENLKILVSQVNSDSTNIVSSNGTENLTVKLGEDNGLVAGDSFDLTLSINDKSHTIKVYIK